MAAGGESGPGANGAAGAGVGGQPRGYTSLPNSPNVQPSDQQGKQDAPSGHPSGAVRQRRHSHTLAASDIRNTYLSRLGYVPLRFDDAGVASNMKRSPSDTFSGRDTDALRMTTSYSYDDLVSVVTSDPGDQGGSTGAGLESPLLGGEDLKAQVARSFEGKIEEETYSQVQESSVTRKKRNLFNPLEYFSPGSVKGSVFNLCSATLGAGCLSLPCAFEQAGILPGMILLVTGMLLTVYSISLLIEVGNLTCLNSYEDLSMHCFGRWMSHLVELSIFLFCFGVCVAYIIAVGDIVEELGRNYLESIWYMLGQRWFLMTLATVFLMFPLGLVEKISNLQFTSFLGVLAIVYLVLAVVARTVQKLVNEDAMPSVNYYGDKTNLEIFLAIPIMMLSFTCQVNVFSIYTELQRPSIRRMNKVAIRATTTCLVMYAIIGAAGYLSFRGDTKGNILNNYSVSDPVMAIAEVGVGLTVILCYPMSVFPTRFTIEMVMFSKWKFSYFRHVFITGLICSTSLGLAILYPKIDKVFGILGATSSSFLCFVLPGMFAVKLRDDPWMSTRILCPLALAVGGGILGVVCTVATVASAFMSPEK